MFSDDGKARKKQPAWSKLLTTDQLHTFITGKQGREDNDNFYSPWARHVVLFNIHQFQLFECLYKIACLSVYISLFHIYMDTVYIQIIIKQQLYPCTLFIHFCLNRLNERFYGQNQFAHSISVGQEIHGLARPDQTRQPEEETHSFMRVTKTAFISKMIR